MSNFFDSDIIQNELKEINFLQGDIYKNILNFGYMTKEEKIKHIEKLTILIEKQKIMYTRLSLSDDSKALEMKENLKKSIDTMGFPPDTDMNILFSNMIKTIESLKKHIDS
jgi:phosphopantetheine adenylyltransferase